MISPAWSRLVPEIAAKAGDLEAFRKSVEDRREFAADSPLEESGFELLVPLARMSR